MFLAEVRAALEALKQIAAGVTRIAEALERRADALERIAGAAESREVTERGTTEKGK